MNIPVLPLQTVDERIQEALDKYSHIQNGKLIVAIPVSIDERFAGELLEHPNVAGLVLWKQPEEAASFSAKTGRFIPERYIWELPPVKANVIFYIGASHEISLRMLCVAIKKHIYRLAYLDDDIIRSDSAPVFIGKRLIERVIGAGFKLLDYLFVRLRKFLKWVITATAHGLAILGLVKKPEDFISRVYLRLLAISRRLEDLNLLVQSRFAFDKLLNIPDVPLLQTGQFVKGRVIQVNSALAWGGAERQVVNTIFGLREKGVMDVSLICERLHDFTDSDFYLWKLVDNDIRVDKLESIPFRHLLQIDGFASIAARLRNITPSVRQTIANYIYVFYGRRPEVVHIWQDSTCVLAGIAACIVGVPVIVLCTRNMAPYRFPYYLAYMKTGYQVLANQSSVRFINNSHAGKADYVSWLNIPEQKFTVVLNGLNTSDVPYVSAEDSSAYRRRLNLPENAVVVGSIFRFYEEKDPLLWIEAAAEIVRRMPDKNVVFLIIGTGPMQHAMQGLANKLQIADRLYLPGTEKNPVLALSVMDMFLLTSLNEGTPNVVIEAQTAGIPVVATDAGGTRDTIISGVTGWLVEDRDPASIADKVVQSLSNSDWLDNARGQASRFAGENFGLERMTSDMLSVYGFHDNPKQKE